MRISRVVSRLKQIFYLAFFLLLILSSITLSLPGKALAGNVSVAARGKYAQAIKALEDKDQAKARELLRQAIKDSPEYAQAHLKLGQLYSERITMFDKAPIELMTVIELSDNPASNLALVARYNLGIIFLKIGDYDKAQTAFQKIIELDSDFDKIPEIYNYLGVTYYHKDMYKESIKQFKRSIQLNPSEDKVVKFNLKSVYKRMEHYNLGMTYFFMKDYNAAIEEMLIAVEVDSNYFEALFHLGDIYLAKGMPGEALRFYQRAVRVNPNHRDIPQVYNGLGVTLYKKGQTMKAIGLLRKALTLRPKYGQARKNLRNIFNSIDQKKLLTADPGKDKEKYIEEATSLAKDYVLVGLYERGITLLEQIIQLDYEAEGVFDHLIDALTQMGDDYLAKENYKHAVNTYKRIIELKGETPELNYKLGICYYKQGKYWFNDAIEAFGKALEVKDARYYLGLTYLERREYVEAAFQIEEVLKRNEENSKAHFLLAKIYRAQGRNGYALDEVKRAIELEPDNVEYQTFMSTISGSSTDEFSGADGFRDISGAEQTPRLVNLLDSPDVLNNKGVSYAKNNMLERAAANFEEGLRKEPGSVELRNNHALLLLMQGDLEEVEK